MVSAARPGTEAAASPAAQAAPEPGASILARQAHRPGMAVVWLLVACAGESNGATPGGGAASWAVGEPRPSADLPRPGDLEPSWDRMSLEMRDAVGGPSEELRAFRRDLRGRAAVPSAGDAECAKDPKDGVNRPQETSRPAGGPSPGRPRRGEAG